MIQRKKGRPRGRPKETPGDLKSVNLMVEIGRFKEFKELCEETGVTTSEGIRQLIDKELEQKNQVGAVNPLGINYNTQQNKCISLLHYLEESINIKEEISSITDHEKLAKLKGIGYSISKSANDQTLLLYKNRPLDMHE